MKRKYALTGCWIVPLTRKQLKAQKAFVRKCNSLQLPQDWNRSFCGVGNFEILAVMEHKVLVKWWGIRAECQGWVFFHKDHDFSVILAPCWSAFSLQWASSYLLTAKSSGSSRFANPSVNFSKNYCFLLQRNIWGFRTIFTPVECFSVHKDRCQS